MSFKCIEDTGRELSNNNVDIVKYLCNIEEERETLENIIQKQYQERKKIEMEIEKLTYKLCLINKSLSMRIKAKNNYDKTIDEIRLHYTQLVDSSNKLRYMVEKTQAELDDIMNKKIGTAATGKDAGNRLSEMDECPCGIEEPTREVSKEEPYQKLQEDYKSIRSTSNSIEVSSVLDVSPQHTDHVGEKLKPTKIEVSSVIETVSPQHSDDTGEKFTTNSQNEPANKTLNASGTLKKSTPSVPETESMRPKISSHESTESKRLTWDSTRLSKGLTITKLKEMKGLKQSLVSDNTSTGKPGSSIVKENDNSHK